MSFLRWTFLNRFGLRAGWRLIVYLSVLVLICLFVTKDPVAGGISPRMYHGQPRLLLFFGLPIIDLSRPFGFLAMFAASIYVAVLLERRPIHSLGLGLSSRWWKELLGGLALGVALLSLIVWGLVAVGAYRFAGPQESWGEAVRWGISIGLVCLGIAFCEEYAFRGYLLQTLIQGVGFRAAAVLSSVAFMSIHIQNQGESPIGLFEVLLFAILTLVLIVKTRSLWAAIGLHATWDWSQNFLYNTADSGVSFPGGLLHVVSRGPDWLSGGAVGPEGSILAILVSVAAIVYFSRASWLRPAPEALAGWQQFVDREQSTLPIVPLQPGVTATAALVPILFVIPSFPDYLPRYLPAVMFVMMTAAIGYKTRQSMR